MATPEPIQRRKLSDEVQDRLLRILHSGALKPGDPLPSERELMSTYGVGRPVVREAMQDLKRKGLVDIRQGGRPTVAEPSVELMIENMSLTMRHILTHSAESMHSLKEARLLLEVQLARTAARKRTSNDIALLRRVLTEQQNARSRSEVFVECDAEFHRTLASISGNPIFESLSRALFDWLAQFHIDQVRQQGLEDLTLREHVAIVDAVEAGSSSAAARAMAQHLLRPRMIDSTPVSNGISEAGGRGLER